MGKMNDEIEKEASEYAECMHRRSIETHSHISVDNIKEAHISCTLDIINKLKCCGGKNDTGRKG